MAQQPGTAAEPWNDSKAVPYIRLKGVTKTFGQFTAVDDVSLDIFRGELFALLGGSGCGKSTLLRMLAGFEVPTAGTIEIDGVDVADVPPYERPVNMMFQSYALFPHMSVEQNVAFGLRQEGMRRAAIRDKVAAILDLVQLRPLARRKPHQLSGGQRQRVALARCLVKEPKLLLLDEPLAALDRKLREQTQFELVNIQERVGITFIVVTHDQEEAMTLATRIGVMDKGRIVQVGPPAEIYEFPRSRFVADFIGTVNMFEGTVKGHMDGLTLVSCPAAGGDIAVEDKAGRAEGATVAVAVRPEKVALSKDEPENLPNRTTGVVTEIAYLGDISIYHLKLDSGAIVRATIPNVLRSARRPITWEDRVWLGFEPHSAVLLAE